MRAAYDALDAGTKAEIEDLVCEHSLLYSRGSLGQDDFTEEERAMFRPVRQRLVRTHPATGRKSLYLSSHAGKILGMPTPEARVLLRDLTEHATQPAFVYAHTWRAARLRHVGQPPDDAPRAPLRREPAARHAPHHPRRRDRLHGELGRAPSPRRLRANVKSALRRVPLAYARAAERGGLGGRPEPPMFTSRAT